MARKAKQFETDKATPSDFNLIVRPVITEKASMQGSTVVFKVAPSSTKDEIKAAVQRIFKVKVKAVRTVNYMGKIKRMGRSVGRRDGWKKAYVSLEEGQTINLIEGL